MACICRRLRSVVLVLGLSLPSLGFAQQPSAPAEDTSAILWATFDRLWSALRGPGRDSTVPVFLDTRVLSVRGHPWWVFHGSTPGDTLNAEHSRSWLAAVLASRRVRALCPSPFASCESVESRAIAVGLPHLVTVDSAFIYAKSSDRVRCFLSGKSPNALAEMAVGINPPQSMAHWAQGVWYGVYYLHKAEGRWRIAGYETLGNADRGCY